MNKQFMGQNRTDIDTLKERGRSLENDLLFQTVQFDKWYFGHYHDNRKIMGKFILLYESIVKVI